MKRIFTTLILLCLPALLYCQQSSTGMERPEGTSTGIIKTQNRGQVVIPNVPSYHWYHGCGPTAMGMVIGYYDVIGFSDLIEGDASQQTYLVQQAIASQQHYADYSEPLDYFPDLFADKSDLGGAHESNSIADYMETSWSSRNNRYGCSWSDEVAQAFIGYVEQQNHLYHAVSQNYLFSTSTWYYYKTEINNDRPVVLLVDSDGDGKSDHFVTGIGYDLSDETYGVYDTWDNQVHWFPWRPMSSSYSWGIHCMNTQKLYYRIASTPFPPAGGSIDGDTYYLAGETASLTAIPQTHFQFVNWSEAGNIISTNETYSFMVSSNRSLTANFELKSYEISAEAVPANGGTISGDTTYIYGDSASLLAGAKAGYKFLHWKENENIVSTDSNYKFMVTGNTNLSAHFELINYSISIQITPPNSGQTEGGGIYHYGDTAILKAIPATAYKFANWSENGNILSTEDVLELQINKNRRLSAAFELQTYTITATPLPESGGEIYGCGSYTHGDSVFLHAIPNDGFEFVNWTWQDSIISENPNYSFQAVEDRNIVANYQLMTRIGEEAPYPDISIFPNPAHNTIKIEIPEHILEAANPVCIYLLDIRGNRIETISDGLHKNNIRFNIDNQPTGVYLVQFVRNNENIGLIKLLIL